MGATIEQKASSSFWIPGGVVLLIVTALVAVVADASGLTNSPSTISTVLRWVGRLVVLGGIACICIGIVIGLRHRKMDRMLSQREGDTQV
jgi:formate hydrogenlyase subunit 3/multisubunit Na+/H+ antiporter MnhD subunit